MRAGKLDRTIIIERAATTVDDYGTPQDGWTTIGTGRAQRIQASTDEFIRAYGADTESTVVYRIRWLDGLKTADRVTDDGQAFDIKEIKELGRRDGLELRCVNISNG